jgi:hypothetical protein
MIRNQRAPHCHFAVIFLAVIVAVIVVVTADVVGLARQAPPAGQASGSVTIDGKSMKIAHAYAWAQPNPFDNQKTDVVVMLTEKPVPPEAFDGVEGLMAVGRRIQGFVLYAINDQGALTSEVVDHPALGGQWIQMSGATRSSFTKKALSTERVEGAFQTPGVEEVLGHKYQAKVQVAADVTPAPRPEPLPDAKTGKPLPAGGGEPGKAYLALHRAVAKNDVPAVLNLMRKTGRTAKDEADLKEGIEFMSAMQPANPKIVNGFVSGDRAVVYVVGTQEKEKEYGTIEMVREEGVWRVGKQHWSNTPPKGR